MPNLADLRFVEFVIEDTRYGVDIDAVERVLPMVALTPLPQAPAIALGVINIHGEIVPVLNVRRRFGLPQREFGLEAKLLLAHTGTRRVALAVDDVLGPLELSRETVVSSDVVLPGIGHVAGIATLPDGLLLIHDLETFLSLEEEHLLSDALEALER